MEVKYQMQANPETTGREDRYIIQKYQKKSDGEVSIGPVVFIGTLGDCICELTRLKETNISEVSEI